MTESMFILTLHSLQNHWSHCAQNHAIFLSHNSQFGASGACMSASDPDPASPSTCSRDVMHEHATVWHDCSTYHFIVVGSFRLPARRVFVFAHHQQLLLVYIRSDVTCSCCCVTHWTRDVIGEPLQLVDAAFAECVLTVENLWVFVVEATVRTFQHLL